MFNFWRLAGLVDGLKPNLPPLSSQKNEMLVFGLPSTSDDWPGWSMDSNPICHPSPAKNMKCSFLDYIQLLMFSRPGRWIWTPSATPLHPKTWNAHFWITFNFRWSARLVNGLKPHLPPLSSEKMKCSFLDYIQLLMFSRPGRWIWTPSATPLQPKTWNAHFWITFNFRWSARLVNGLKPHLPPLSSEKMKCLFLDYLQLLMIGRAGRWTWTPSTTSLQPKKWNAHFWITFNFWWLAGLVDGLQPCVPPLCSQKNEMLIFRLHSTSDDWPAGPWTRTPSATPLQPKTWNAHFWITFNFWWSGGLVDRLEPHLPPISSQKNEMLIFGLRSTSDDQEGWLIDSNPICHPSPATKMKCSFLDYVQLLMISWTGQWTQMPSTTPLQL